MAKLTDERDRLQEEVDRLHVSAGANEEQKELENRLHDEIDSLSSVRQMGCRNLDQADLHLPL